MTYDPKVSEYFACVRVGQRNYTYKYKYLNILNTHVSLEIQSMLIPFINIKNTLNSLVILNIKNRYLF